MSLGDNGYRQSLQNLIREMTNLIQVAEYLDPKSNFCFITLQESNVTNLWRWQDTQTGFVYCGEVNSETTLGWELMSERKSTRLNSSH